MQFTTEFKNDQYYIVKYPFECFEVLGVLDHICLNPLLVYVLIRIFSKDLLDVYNILI